MERHTRRRLSGGIVLAAVALATLAVGHHQPQRGIFALIGGKATSVARLRTQAAPGGATIAHIRLYESDGTTPILDFRDAMERTMHIVVVRDDFVTFAHVHPHFDATTGTFTQTLTHLDPNHRYYLYADTTPTGMRQQVFRFALHRAVLPAVAPAETLDASPTTQPAGPYRITLAKTTVPADLATTLAVTVRERGRPAKDLEAYLGAAAHAVFIDTATLGYYHVHPTLRGTSAAQAMADAMRGHPQSGPLLELAVPPLRAGAYKLWLQVRKRGGTVYTADFTLVAH